MFGFGILGLLMANVKIEKSLLAIVFIVGLLLIIGIPCVIVEIPKGSIGIDQNGNWYSSGIHATFEKVKKISLKGSVPLWKENLALSYDLTPEEIMSLERGSNFQERLRSMYIYSIDENWNATMTKTSEVPPGFETSHLKLMISF